MNRIGSFHVKCLVKNQEEYESLCAMFESDGPLTFTIRETSKPNTAFSFSAYCITMLRIDMETTQFPSVVNFECESTYPSESENGQPECPDRRTPDDRFSNG